MRNHEEQQPQITETEIMRFSTQLDAYDALRYLRAAIRTHDFTDPTEKKYPALSPKPKLPNKK